MTDAAPPAAETDVILGDLGVLLLECGVSVTDVRGSLEQVGRRAASTPQASLEFAILPEMVMVSRPGASSATTKWLVTRKAAIPARFAKAIPDRSIPPLPEIMASMTPR